jgi:hypothetical protein
MISRLSTFPEQAHAGVSPHCGTDNDRAALCVKVGLN